MTSLIESYLATHGPCLTSAVSEYLVEVHRMAPAAARKRVSRVTDGANSSVKQLAGIPFPRKGRFVYLQRISDRLVTGVRWRKPFYLVNRSWALDLPRYASEAVLCRPTTSESLAALH